MAGDLLPFQRPELPRQHPHNAEAEQALLGSLLLRNQLLHDVADILAPEHFAEAIHQRIFGAIATLIARGEPANPVTLKTLFDDDGSLTTMGGSLYLVHLAGNAGSAVNAKTYARTIIELWRRRQLIQAALDLARDAADPSLEMTADHAISRAEEAFHALADPANASGPQPFDRVTGAALGAAEAVFQRAGSLHGITTGLIDLDDNLGGLCKTDLIILAGRPGMGKSALAGGIAKAAARSGEPVYLASLEMSATQFAQRLFAGETGISADRQRRGPLSRDDMERLIEASSGLKALPIEIDDTAAVSVAQVRSRAIRMQRRRGLSLVIVDYLQLMVGGDEQNRVQEVSKITRDLKCMAKELKVPVLALSQLSRAVESRDDKRPQLSDLRESGSIEQDADIVIFCYRAEQYLGRAQPQQSAFKSTDQYDTAHATWCRQLNEAAGKAELLIRKNRHGPEGTVAVRFDGVKTKFENLGRW